MKLVWGLIFLISMISASAAFFPEPGVIFEYKGATCFPNGSVLINLTHEGNSLPFKKINFSVESESFSGQVQGKWMIGVYPVSNFEYPDANYTGDDFVSKSRFKFKTTNNIYTKGKYIFKLSWPSYSIYQDNIKFAVECPGIKCSSNDDCISQQSCSNQTCEWVKCPNDKIATGHTCLAKCNDYNTCTNDYLIDEQCVYVKIKNCETVEEKTNIPQVKSYNIFKIFWNWLKSKYQ